MLVLSESAPFSQTGVRGLSPKAHDTGLELKLTELLLSSTVASIFE